MFEEVQIGNERYNIIQVRIQKFVPRYAYMGVLTNDVFRVKTI